MRPRRPVQAGSAPVTVSTKRMAPPEASASAYAHMHVESPESSVCKMSCRQRLHRTLTLHLNLNIKRPACHTCSSPAKAASAAARTEHSSTTRRGC